MGQDVRRTMAGHIQSDLPKTAESQESSQTTRKSDGGTRSSPSTAVRFEYERSDAVREKAEYLALHLEPRETFRCGKDNEYTLRHSSRSRVGICPSGGEKLEETTLSHRRSFGICPPRGDKLEETLSQRRPVEIFPPRGEKLEERFTHRRSVGIVPPCREKLEEMLPHIRDTSQQVPNIVVEHVMSRDVHSQSLTPPGAVSVMPDLSPLSLPPTFASRQIRAHSDSSVHDLRSSYIPSSTSEFRYLLPQTWRSLTSVGEGSFPASSGDFQTALNLKIDVAKCEASRLTALAEPIEGENRGLQSTPTVPFQYQFETHRECFSPGKSPKTYWMRRHSDSNLASRLGLSLRAEPYPIRSRSTGDSIPCSAVRPETGAPDVHESDSVLQAEEGDREGTDVGLLDKHVAEKFCGLYEKRLKLKKYLQTRYQSSLQEMRQSSEGDDVFTDRTVDPPSPTPVVPTEPIQLHIDVSPAEPSTVFASSEGRTRQEIFRFEKVKFGRKRLSGTELPCDVAWRSPSDMAEPVELYDMRTTITKEDSLSPVSTSSERPVFVFPTVSTVCVSDSHIHSSWVGQHVSQTRDSSSFLGPTSTIKRTSIASELSPTSICSQQYTSSFTRGYSPTHWLYGDVRSHQYILPTQPENAGPSHLPLLVDLPSEKSTSRRCPRLPDKWTRMLSLSRPQSYSSLVTYSSVPDQFSHQLARFPSTPILSESCSSFGPSWQDPGEASPSLVSRRLSTTSSEKSFEGRRSYAALCEAGSEDSPSRLEFSCPLCSQEFASYNHLANHMSSHLPPEPTSKEGPAESPKVHSCRICNRTFSRSDMLTRHTRLHTGNRPYECHLCGQVFSRSDHLHTHLRTHTGEKPYRCSNCPYAAPRRDMVTRHMRIHTRETPQRGRRSSSVSSDVPISPMYPEHPGVPSEEPHRRVPSFSSDDPVRPGHTTLDPTDLSLVRRIVGCRTHSLTSCESTEGSDTPHVCPACQTWSSTSTESFDSFPSPRTRERLSWSSSTDSPDVFSRTPQQFFWSARAAAPRLERGQESIVDSLSMEIQASFEQRCTVTTPEYVGRIGTEDRPVETLKSQEVKVKLEEGSTPR